MSTEEKIIKNKVGLLKLAKILGLQRPARSWTRTPDAACYAALVLDLATVMS
jgi:hypothetical protein